MMDEQQPPEPALRDPGLLLPRGLLMTIGGLLLGFVIAAGAYSMAVAGGEDVTPTGAGAGIAPPQRAGGFQPNPGGNLPQPGPDQQRGTTQPPSLQALPIAPDLIGTIQSVSSASLTVRGQDGQQVLGISVETVVYRVDGSRGTLADLERGMTVGVVTTGGANRSITAEAIAILR